MSDDRDPLDSSVGSPFDPAHMGSGTSLMELETRLASATAPRRQASILHEMGRMHEALGNARLAASCYQRAFKADPTHLPTLQSGRRLFTEAGRWVMVLHLMEAEAKVHVDPARAAALHVHRGELLLWQFNRPKAAKACFEQSMALIEPTPRAGVGLATSWCMLGDRGRQAEALMIAARCCVDPGIATGLALEASRVHLSLGNDEVAVRVLEGVLTVDAQHTGALSLLARAHREAGRWPDYVSVGRARARMIVDTQGRARALVDLARICHSELDDVASGLALLEEAIEQDPRAPGALDTLVTLYVSAERWDEAADALERVASLTEDPMTRVTRLERLARLRLERLDDDAGAATALSALLEIEPGWLPALELLGGLYAAAGEWPAMVGMYRAELLTVGDPRQRAARFFKIGEIYELHLEDWTQAARAYREVVELDPAFHYAARGLSRMLQRLGDWAGYVELMLEEAERAGSLADRIDQYTRVAEAQMVHLGQPEAAITTWNRVRALAPDNLLAIRNLARLYARSGQIAALIEMNRLELPLVEDSVRKVHLLVKTAELLTAEGDAEGATPLLEEALVLEPHSVPALQALGRIHQRLGHFEQLVRMYRNELAQTNSGSEAVNLHLKIARVLREQSGDLQGAAIELRSALDIDSAHLVALRALRQVRTEQGDTAAEARLLAAECPLLQDSSERAALLFGLGTMYSQQLGRPDKAIDAWQLAVELDPQYTPAVDALVAACEADDALRALIRLREDLAGRCPAEQSVNHWLESARLADEGLGDSTAAIESYRRVLELEPGHVGSLLGLERLFVMTGEPAELAAVYGQLAAVTLEPSTRAGYLKQQGGVEAEQLDRGALAAERYKAAFELNPGDPELLLWLENRAVAADDVELLASILERRLEVASTAGEQAAVLSRAGEALRRAGQASEAARCFKAAVALDGDNIVPQRALERLERESGLVHELPVEVSVERVPTEPPRPRPGTLEPVAPSSTPVQLFTDAIDRLRQNPDDPDALRAARALAQRNGLWAELAQALELRARTRPDFPPEVFLEVADLYAARLARPDHAARALESFLTDALEQAPSVLQRLADLYVDLESWSDAARVYEQLLLASIPAPLQRAIAFRLAAIYEDKLANNLRAQRCLVALVDGHSEDIEAVDRLATLVASGGDIRHAAQLLRDAIPHIDPPVRALPWRRRLAAYEAQLGHFSVAVHALEAALASRPEDWDTLYDLGRLHATAGDVAALRGVFGEALDRLGTGEAERSTEIRRAMAELTLEANGPLDLVIGDLTQALQQAPADHRLRELHAETLELQGSPKALDAWRWLLGNAPFEARFLRAYQAAAQSLGAWDAALEASYVLEALGSPVPASEDGLDGWAQLVRDQPKHGIAEGALLELLPKQSRALVAALGAVLWAVPEVFTPEGGGGSTLSDASEAQVRQVAGLFEMPVGTVRADGRPLHQMFATPGGIALSVSLDSVKPRQRSYELGVVFALGSAGLSALSRWQPDALQTLLEAALGVRGGASSDSASVGDLGSLRDGLSERLLHQSKEVALLRRSIGSWDLARIVADVHFAAERLAAFVCGSIEPALVSTGRHLTPDVALERTHRFGRWATSVAYLEGRIRHGLVPPRPTS